LECWWPTSSRSVDRKTKDGKKHHAWKVRYRDPDRVERSATFAKKGDAEDFASTIESDILRGDFVDPRAGRSGWRTESRCRELACAGQHPEGDLRIGRGDPLTRLGGDQRVLVGIGRDEQRRAIELHRHGDHIPGWFSRAVRRTTSGVDASIASALMRASCGVPNK